LAIGINHAGLRHILARRGCTTASENVVVAENVIGCAIGDERAKGTAAAKPIATVVDIASGHAEVLVTASMIGAAIRQRRYEKRPTNYKCEDCKDN
jgi:hypothetical protein